MSSGAMWAQFCWAGQQHPWPEQVTATYLPLKVTLRSGFSLVSRHVMLSLVPQIKIKALWKSVSLSVLLFSRVDTNILWREQNYSSRFWIWCSSLLRFAINKGRLWRYFILIMQMKKGSTSGICSSQEVCIFIAISRRRVQDYIEYLQCNCHISYKHLSILLS